jgi:shikimate kinase
VAVPLDEPTGLGPGQDWVWREDRIQDLLSTDDADMLFISGCAPNQGKFYAQFDHIVLLTAPAAVIVERLGTRTTNPYGKHPDEVARILYLQQTVEPLLRRGAGLEVDTTASLDHVVATILGLVQSPTGPP